MKTITLKKTWVRTDGWRGYEKPINAVCGANDTGSWDDSPCPTSLRKKELAMAAAVLRANKIPYKSTICRSSNIFCAHVYLVVAEEDVEIAKGLIEPLVEQTTLLYIA